MISGEGGAQSPPTLYRIESRSRMTMDEDTVRRNIDKSFKRGLKKFHEHPALWQPKDGPLAIVAGGPSLNSTFKLAHGMTVMASGSAHDHAVRLGLKLDYCVIVDPDPVAANYVRQPQSGCQYLITSQCDDAVFEALKDHDVWVWHSGGFGKDEDDRVFRKEPRFGGGCTVTLRALVLGIALGYWDQHFFGFDSCVTPDEHHAYQSEAIDGIHDVRVVGSNRVFYAAPYMRAQASQFQDALRYHGKLFRPTVYGDGLIAEILKVGNERALGLSEQMQHAEA